MDVHGRDPRLHVGFTPATRLVRRMMITVVGMFALWGVAPAAASVRVGWRLNGIPLTESAATGWKGKLKLTDTNTIAGSEAVECEDKAAGSSGLSGTGEVTTWTASNCVGTEACEKAGAVVTPVNLPWHTELVKVEGTLHDVLVSGGKGIPGYKVKCKTFGVYVEDECTGTLSTTTTNTESGVTATFNKSEKLQCRLGGKGSGILEGSQSVIASEGGKLSAEMEESPAAWHRNGVHITTAKAIGWKGTVTLSDSGTSLGTIAVKCEDTGSGLAGAEFAGEMTKWTMSNCAPALGSSCESGASIEALNLPWHTELFTLSGAIRDLITGSGKGKPGYKLKCKALGENITDECLAVPTTTMTNTINGVTAAFTKEKFTCADGRVLAGSLEGSQAITLNEGGLLSVS